MSPLDHFLTDVLQLKTGTPHDAVYNQTMYVLAGLLAVGFVCNLLVRPVAARFFMTDEEVAAERKASVKSVAREEQEQHADFEDFVEEGREAETGTKSFAATAAQPAGAGTTVALALAWLAVGAPLAWGVWITLMKTAAMFNH